MTKQRLTNDEWAEVRSVVAGAARDLILPRFRALDARQIDAKAHAADLVTVADTEAEAAITAALRARWPQAVILGEEAVSSGVADPADVAGAERAFIIDPVDGTWNFAKGLAVFGVILAVVEAGRTTRALLYDPLFDDVIEAADGQGAWQHRAGGDPVRLDSTQENGEPLNGFLPLNLLPADLRATAAEALLKLAKFYSLRCSCHEYRMLALGHVDFCLSGPAPNAWDHAAGVRVMQEAGGAAAMLDGSEYGPEVTRGYLLTARTQEIWSKVAATLLPVLGPGR